MKNLTFILVLLISSGTIIAQETLQKSRSEIKAEKKALRIEEVKNLIDDKTFVFNAMQVFLKNKNIICLPQFYTVKIETNQITSFLPIQSLAFEEEVEIQDSPFTFKQSIEKYNVNKKDKNIVVRIETTNEDELVIYTFTISKYGHTSLRVTNTNRQCISFKGIINQTEILQATN